MEVPRGELPIFTIRVNERAARGSKIVVLVGFLMVFIWLLIFLVIFYGQEETTDLMLWGGIAFILALYLPSMFALQWIFNRYTKPVLLYIDGIEFRRSLVSIILRREGYIPKVEIESAISFRPINEMYTGSMSIKTKSEKSYFIGKRFYEDIQNTTRIMRESWGIPVEVKERTIPQSTGTGSPPQAKPTSYRSNRDKSPAFSFCPNCGARLQMGFAFCPVCGRKSS